MFTGPQAQLGVLMHGGNAFLGVKLTIPVRQGDTSSSSRILTLEDWNTPLILGWVGSSCRANAETNGGATSRGGGIVLGGQSLLRVGCYASWQAEKPWFQAH